MEYTMSPVTELLPQERSTIRYAGFWRRFVAFVLDWLILGIVISVTMSIFDIGFFSGHYTPYVPPAWTHHTGDSAGVAGAKLCLWIIYITGGLLCNKIVAGWPYIMGGWLYHALMESSKQQGTLGKMALGLRVTDLDGKRITFGRLTGRYFSKVLSFITLFIGYMMAGWTKKKQALHDLIAGTLVARTR